MESLLLKYPKTYKHFSNGMFSTAEFEAILFDDTNLYLVDDNGDIIRTTPIKEIQGHIIGLTYPNGVASLATTDLNEWEKTLTNYESKINSNQNKSGVVVKEITMRKSSGFQYSLNVCIVNTPKGKIRTITIKDHEVGMADKPLSPPGDTMTIICNDNDLDTNKEQLREFCEFLLEELK